MQDFAMRVLVVEDDAKIAAFVVSGLKQAGYAVDRAVDALRAAGCRTGISTTSRCS